MYSLTTTTDQGKGTAEPPPEKPFPLPYKDDYESYPLGCTTPRYCIEQNGCYEVAPCAGGRSGKALRQVVNQVPIFWTYGPKTEMLGTASVLGEKTWRNYAVAADVLLEEPGYGRVMGRVSRVDEEGHIQGYQLYVREDGRWELCHATADGVMAAGQVPFSLNTWHRLELNFHEDTVVATIDGRKVAELKDTRYRIGMAGFGNGFNRGQYDNFEIKAF